MNGLGVYGSEHRRRPLALYPDAFASHSKLVYRAQRKVHAEIALGQRAVLHLRADEIAEAKASHQSPMFGKCVNAGAGDPNGAETCTHASF